MADFQFLHPNWFYTAIPALILCGWLYSKPQRTSLIASHLTQQLGFDKRQSHRSIVSLISTAWLIAIIALAGPSFQKQEVPSFGVNNARVIVMDMTLSMYATDIAPNRLTQARYKVMDLLPALKEGATGLIAYSGDGYMISPLTRDTNTLANLIPNLSPDIMPTRGSNAAAGVKKAISMLTQAGHQQGDIILVADDISAEDTRGIQNLLNGTNWQLSVMSVGTQQGAPIRLPNGNMFTSNGMTVVAKTNVEGLQALAESGNGVYTPLRANDRDIQTLAAALDHVELKTIKENKGSPELEVHINNGFWLLPILLLLALGGFRRGGLFCLAAMLSFPLLQPHNAYAAETTSTSTPTSASIPKTGSEFTLHSVFKTRDQQGYEAYQAKNYTQAATSFENQAWQGAAQYQAGNYQAAIQSLNGLTDERSRYNLANAQAQSGQLEQAKSAYEAILQSNPNHTDAKKNLDIVNKALQQQQQQQDKSKDQQSKDNQSQDQQPQDKPSQNDQGEPSNKNDSDSNSQENQSQQDQSKQNQSDQKKSDQQPSQQSSEQNQSDNSQQNQQENGKNDHRDQADNKSTNDNPNSNNPNSSNNSPDENQKQDEQKTQQASQSEQDKEKQQQAMAAQQDPKANPQVGNTVVVDSQLKKLEQIPDNAKRLLQAQMALEAQQNPEPQTNGQQW